VLCIVTITWLKRVIEAAINEKELAKLQKENQQLAENNEVLRQNHTDRCDECSGLRVKCLKHEELITNLLDLIQDHQGAKG